MQIKMKASHNVKYNSFSKQLLITYMPPAHAEVLMKQNRILKKKARINVKRESNAVKEAEKLDFNQYIVLETKKGGLD
jgi:hypothetical protein